MSRNFLPKAVLGESKVALPLQAKQKGPRYTPVSRRHERPSAILWLMRVRQAEDHRRQEAGSGLLAFGLRDFERGG